MFDLYLLAHPDDDLFVRPLFHNEVIGHKVVYLTNGKVPGPITPYERQREAVSALNEAGITQIEWLGIDLGVDVYHLIRRLADIYEKLTPIAKQGELRRVVTHAWEGGHPDHDGAHLLGQALAREFGVLGRSIALPYYRGSNWPLIPFTVMSPLAENGEFVITRLLLRDALFTLWGLRLYPTQLIPLLGLFPGMFWRILVQRKLFQQLLGQSTAPLAPPVKRILYEKRNGITFKEFKRFADEFLDTFHD